MSSLVSSSLGTINYPRTKVRKGSSNLTSGWGLSISTRFYFSTSHLRAANHFRAESERTEQPFEGDPAPIRGRPSEEIQQALFKHNSYVVGAVFSAVAFLEALINELFLDTVDEHQAGPAQQVPAGVRERLAEAWRRSTENLAILTIFQAALVLAGKASFDPGRQPYQAVKVLIDLRNNLVHFEPATRSAADRTRFEGRLQAQNFSLHPWYENSPGNPVFPDKCLSHGCAEWAFSSSLRFADEFCSRMQITPNYQHFRPT